MNNDAKHRYEELMTQHPQLYNLIPKHLIAAYLGLSRETLSRLYHSSVSVNPSTAYFDALYKPRVGTVTKPKTFDKLMM